MINSIEPEDLNNKLSKSEPLTLLDVRRKADYEADPGNIPGATWRDPEKIETWIKEIPSGNPIVVYCVRGGSVSRSVVQRLEREGFQAAFLEGGLKGWQDRGQQD